MKHMIEPDESLLALLDKSNSEVLEGHTITMDEVDLFMKNKVNELTNPVDAYCVAKSF